MIKILSGSEVSILDKHHIQGKGISSHQLMEKAAEGFVDWFLEKRFSSSKPIALFCGAGNNGGDGLAIARLLTKHGFQCVVFTCFADEGSLSEDCRINLGLLPSAIRKFPWNEFDSEEFGLVIDAYLGVGIKGPLREEAKSIIDKINSFKGIKVSVDLPSGLSADYSGFDHCVHAEVTVTFAFPKLTLLLPEHAKVTGELVLVDIGISEEELEVFHSSYYYLLKKDIPAFHKKFHRFSHKGDFGKVLLIAGSRGKMGAAALSVKAAFRTGSGLVSCQVPLEERIIIQTSVPEAMCVFEDSIDWMSFDAIGVGPGIGLDQGELLEKLLREYDRPIVMDADALTLLSRNPSFLDLIPKESILTPHLGEFERLFGKCRTHLERLEKARRFCMNYKLNVLIKGANSVICLADGRQIFNSSGSHFMATAGMGDVLTGMITSFLGQGYSSEQALVCGVYQHGLAGEMAGDMKGRGTLASDVIEMIPETFKRLGVS